MRLRGGGRSRRGTARLAGLALAVSLAASAGACAEDRSAASETLTVFAAASLTTTFEELGERFEAAHDGVGVQFSFGGSADLAEQIRSGAPADVFASADQPTMDLLSAEDLVTEPRAFATNVLQIATPPGNPAGVGGFADLADTGLRLVVCAPEVPCGAATARMAALLGVELRPVSEEQAVTDVLGKVGSGEADAGVVYVTDVLAARGTVEGVALPEAALVVNTYPIAAVAGGEQAALAQEFVDFVAGPEGRNVLADAGFGAP